MVECKLRISAKSLKSILTLFSNEQEFDYLCLGDTLYQSEGFVNEDVLEGRKMVREIVDFPYDFKGLVHFEGKLEDITINYIPSNETKCELYEINGNIKKLRSIESKIIELNVYDPGTFKYEVTER